MVSLIRSCLTVSIVILFCGVFPGCLEKTWMPSSDETYQVYVASVIDGDTIRVILPDGVENTIRFLGIDAPELSIDANKPFEFGNISNMSCLKEYGWMAKSFVNDQILHKEICIEFDVSAGFQDSYGRLLAYVYTINGADLNALLVQQGFSRVYTEETFSKELYYVQFEKEAMKNKTGFWGCSDIKDTVVQIFFVHYDALGNDGINLNDEYVCIKYNTKEKDNISMDLAGYSLSDDDGYSYVFPIGFGLDDGQMVIIHTGIGENNLTDLYWGSTNPIWNNDGEIAYLRNKNGAIIDTYQWN